MADVYSWYQSEAIKPREFVCGYCGNRVGSDRGYRGHTQNGLDTGHRIYICPFCRLPSYFGEAGRQAPGAAHGNRVEHLPNDVEALYDEARASTAASSYTAAVLCCRKILMHVAVDAGAPSNKPFAEYVEYLAANHYVPPNARPWVDHIRNKGNEANHEIKLMNQAEAEGLISFVEMLLKLVYELPAKIPKPGP